MSLLTPRINKFERNFIINGNFDFWQRGTTLTATDASSRYLADRFFFFSNGNAPVANITLSRSIDVPVVNSNAQYSVRFQRNSGNANISGTYLGQAIESVFARDLRGKECTIAFWAKKGANYSPTGSALAVQMHTGIGIDEGATGAYTGQVTAITTSVTLTASWQRFTISVPALNSDINEARLLFISQHVGAAGVDDSFYITGLTLLDANVLSPNYSYAAGDYINELQLCQRYYEKSYDLTINPGTASSNPGYSFFTGQAVTNMGLTIYMKQTKRATPVVIIYSFNGTINSLDSGSGVVAASVRYIGQSSFNGWSPALNGITAFHYIAAAEL